MYTLISDAIPKPLAWGSLQIRAPFEAIHFLTEFVQFDNSDLPDPDAAGVLIARLYASSKGTSPSIGTIGQRFDGLLLYVNGWEPTWQTLFAKMLTQIYHYNCLNNKIWDELHAAFVSIIKFVVPRLLKELEKGGRKIEPCFIDGDLWNGNFGVAANPEKVCLFDSSGYYARQKMEFACWRTQHHGMHGKDYCGT